MYSLLRKYTKDGLWAAIFGPVFVLAEVVFDAGIPYVMSLIIDVGINQKGGDLNYIINAGFWMVLLALGAGICGALSGWLSSIASARFVRNIRLAIYSKIQTYSFKSIEKFPVPSVVMRLTTDMRMMRLAYVAIVRLLIRAPSNLLISLFMVYRMNNRLAGIFAIAIPILATGFYFMTIKAHPRFVTMMGKYDQLNSDLEEDLEGIRVVKTFVREKYEEEKFKKVSWTVTLAQRYAESLVLLTQPFFELVMYACMIAIAWFGGNLIIQGNMTTGVFMSYLAYVRAILFSLMMLSNGLMQIVMAQASVDRANELLNEETDITDDKNDVDLNLEDGSLEFRNVNFRYDSKSENEALTGINLKIPSGKVVGIIGPTGAGKSTLVQLIPRLYDVSAGEVLVGGHNVKDYKLNKLREEVSMVLQKNTLFSGTIEDNLKWGNSKASKEEITKAATYAQAEEFIQHLPEGYKTELGQGGVNVSGGQKQRLCIARALLKHPKIIILDDSTSAVDTDTDRRIQLALKEKLTDMTTIIIAQRITSVLHADMIVIMDEGKIVDKGTHDELLKRNTMYQDLYHTQMGGVGQ